jgi:hypothetical protein
MASVTHLCRLGKVRERPNKGMCFGWVYEWCVNVIGQVGALATNDKSCTILYAMQSLLNAPFNEKRRSLRHRQLHAMLNKMHRLITCLVKTYFSFVTSVK